MDIFQIDEEGHLFIAPDIDDWQLITAHGITAVFDLDSDLDIGVPKPRHDLRYTRVHVSRPYPVSIHSNNTNCCVELN
jgi:hypothetical protein